MERPQPGSASLIGRLTELLFIEVLRSHIAVLREHDVGWLAALGDRQVGRALEALHSRLGDAWTAAKLARNVGMSRSALDERFRGFLGMSPMRYLSVWRLHAAAHALRTSQTTISDVAADAGYGSDEAFSRAFKRLFGVSPGAWRSGKPNSHMKKPQAAPPLKASPINFPAADYDLQPFLAGNL
jgi:AraC-like DNA-binding protein